MRGIYILLIILIILIIILISVYLKLNTKYIVNYRYIDIVYTWVNGSDQNLILKRLR